MDRIPRKTSFAFVRIVTSFLMSWRCRSMTTFLSKAGIAFFGFMHDTRFRLRFCETIDGCAVDNFTSLALIRSCLIGVHPLRKNSRFDKLLAELAPQN